MKYLLEHIKKDFLAWLGTWILRLLMKNDIIISNEKVNTRWRVDNINSKYYWYKIFEVLDEDNKEIKDAINNKTINYE